MPIQPCFTILRRVERVQLIKLPGMELGQDEQQNFSFTQTAWSSSILSADTMTNKNASLRKNQFPFHCFKEIKELMFQS